MQEPGALAAGRLPRTGRQGSITGPLSLAPVSRHQLLLLGALLIRLRLVRVHELNCIELINY
jgi:hypothetical protein